MEIWIRPEDIHHQVMIMMKSNDPFECQMWNRAMAEATKPYGGFRQINSPLCGMFCDDHWTCPGMYGWELFAHHNVPWYRIMSILEDAQTRALQLMEAFNADDKKET